MMKIKRLYSSLFAFAVALMPVCVSAANVEWNFLRSSYLEYVGDGNVYQVFSWSETMYYMTILVSPSISGWGPAQGVDAPTSIWVREMSVGTRICRETMLADGLDFFYVGSRGEVGIRSDYFLDFDDGSKYLAFALPAYDLDTNPLTIFGWMEVDPDFNVLSSAWDVDGGSMIVGGGAIPEPTSAVLLLLGLAGLGLKRKRVTA